MALATRSVKDIKATPTISKQKKQPGTFKKTKLADPNSTLLPGLPIPKSFSFFYKNMLIAPVLLCFVFIKTKSSRLFSPVAPPMIVPSA